MPSTREGDDLNCHLKVLDVNHNFTIAMILRRWWGRLPCCWHKTLVISIDFVRCWADASGNCRASTEEDTDTNFVVGRIQPFDIVDFLLKLGLKIRATVMKRISLRFGGIQVSHWFSKVGVTQERGSAATCLFTGAKKLQFEVDWQCAINGLQQLIKAKFHAAILWIDEHALDGGHFALAHAFLRHFQGLSLGLEYSVKNMKDSNCVQENRGGTHCKNQAGPSLCSFVGVMLLLQKGDGEPYIQGIHYCNCYFNPALELKIIPYTAFCTGWGKNGPNVNDQRDGCNNALQPSSCPIVSEDNRHNDDSFKSKEKAKQKHRN